MGKVKVTCEINTYNEPSKPSIRIHSHWNRSRWVEIEVNGEKIVVDGEELKTAVDNCMNVFFSDWRMGMPLKDEKPERMEKVNKMFIAIFKMLRLIHTDNLIIVSLLTGKDFEDKDIQILFNSFNEIVEEINDK